MKIALTDKIRKVLKEAGSIKDKITPLCKPEYNYPSKARALFMCRKCYPNQPERSKREDSQKCEMRCSEHCSNAVRDK